MPSTCTQGAHTHARAHQETRRVVVLDMPPSGMAAAAERTNAQGCTHCFTLGGAVERRGVKKVDAEAECLMH